MKSFTRNLVLNFMAVVFGGFVLIYFLFNFIVESHVREEAERELATSIESIVRDIYIMPRIVLDIERGFVRLPDVEAENFVRVLQPINQSIITTNAILINAQHQIVSPLPLHLTEDEVAEVLFLANYYVENLHGNASEELVIAHSDTHTYYLKSIQVFDLSNGYMSVLVYTDISYAMAFIQRMNQILGILLTFSGLLSLSISLLLSRRFKKSIMKLSSRALAIGQGNYNTTSETFKYAEFEALSQSMNEMADMLQTYERNQKQFFQNVSHELRTPLMSIQGYAEGIMGDIFDRDAAAKVIIEESENMTELISQLLYISRLDSGMDNGVKLENLNISEALASCRERMDRIASHQGKTIVLELPPKSLVAFLDESKLETILTNILNNAIRHAEKKITIRAWWENGLVITIVNDGPGIEAQDLPHIFKRFYKGEDGHTGLGLSICQALIQQLDGEIKAENTNIGVRFTLLFKVEPDF